MKAGDPDPSSLSRKTVVYTTSNLGYNMLQHKTLYFSDFLVTCILFAVCGQSNGLFASELTSVDKDSSLVVENKTPRPIVINGHTLPPMPDKTLNDATLLGIDSNNNGVRDDVEIKIMHKFKRPIEQALMIQYAKMDLKILKNPTLAAESEELDKELFNVEACYGYLREHHKLNIGKEYNIKLIQYLEGITYNNKMRIEAYMVYNQGKSGESYSVPNPWRDLIETACDFNVTEIISVEK